MNNRDLILTAIARKHLGITTLNTRSSDCLDFDDLSVWGIHAALAAAYQAGSVSTRRNAPVPNAATSDHSTSPWAYEYNPYTVQRGDEPGVDLPAFEIFDAEGNKLFDTNEDMPSDVQEANARLASAAPELLAVLDRCAILLADYDEQDGEEGDAYRDAIAVITAATSERREP